MATKLARQMAYKKKLEEEFRLAEERRKYEKKSKYYEHKSFNYEAWHCEDLARNHKRDSVFDFDFEDIKREEKELKEKEKRKKAEYEKEKNKWMKMREVYTEKAAKFADLKRKRLKEKARIEESKKYINEEEA